MSRLKQSFLALLAITAIGIAGSEALARPVPYKAAGTGAYSPVTGDYCGPGISTRFGRLTFAGNIATTPTDNPLVFNFHSTVDQVNTHANGDKISFAVSGSVQLIPLDDSFTTFTAVWTGEFTVTGGTGRFEGAKPADKPISVIAVNAPFTFAESEWFFVWKVDGEIELP
jgi:hypothetical protein